MPTHKRLYFSFFQDFLLLITAIGLTACDNTQDIAHLKAYITRIKINTQPKTAEILSMTQSESIVIQQHDKTPLRNPFALVQKENKFPQSAKMSVNRIKEPLESISLEQLQMVGSVQIDTVFWALVKDNKNAIHRLKIGNYLGENAGKITHIDATKIDLVEMIPNEQGKYTKHLNNLFLTQ